MRGPGSAKLERLVQGLHGALDVGGRDVAGDLDGRRRDDLRLDADRPERLEGLRRNARVAFHPGPDEADLAKVVAHRPVDAERSQQLLARAAVLERRAEDDLVARDLE